MPIYLAENATAAVGSVAGAATSAIGSVAGAGASGVKSAAGAGASAVTPKSAAPSFHSVLGSWSFIPLVLGLAGLVASI